MINGANRSYGWRGREIVATIARILMECARPQIKLLVGDCGAWIEVAPFDPDSALANGQSWPGQMHRSAWRHSHATVFQRDAFVMHYLRVNDTARAHRFRRHLDLGISEDIIRLDEAPNKRGPDRPPRRGRWRDGTPSWHPTLFDVRPQTLTTGPG